MVIGHWSLVIGHWSGRYLFLPLPPAPCLTGVGYLRRDEEVAKRSEKIKKEIGVYCQKNAEKRATQTIGAHSIRAYASFDDTTGDGVGVLEALEW